MELVVFLKHKMNYIEGNCMKSFKFFWILLVACLPTIVKASDNGMVEVSSEYELETCLRDAAVCKLVSDVSIRYSMGVKGNTILNLNGHSITPADSLKINGGFIVVERGGKLTIKDSTGGGKISTGDASDSSVWGGVQLGKDDQGTDLMELVVDGGTIEGYYYGVVGNGAVHNTKITINGGSIKGLNVADSVGLYHPQKGDLVINGGEISGGTGIEVRSGNVTINNGNILGIAPTFTKTANGSGSTTNGVGLAIAQHTSKNPISVTVNGGNLSGKYAFYEWNPHNNNRTDLDKIKINIKGGDFKSTLEDGYAVYSQDFTKFISGGKFNTSVSEYLTDDASLAAKEVKEEDKVKNNTKKKSRFGIVIGIPAAIVAGVLGLYIYKKKAY